MLSSINFPHCFLDGNINTLWKETSQIHKAQMRKYILVLVLNSSPDTLLVPVLEETENSFSLHFSLCEIFKYVRS